MVWSLLGGEPPDTEVIHRALTSDLQAAIESREAARQAARDASAPLAAGRLLSSALFNARASLAHAWCGWRAATITMAAEATVAPLRRKLHAAQALNRSHDVSVRSSALAEGQAQRAMIRKKLLRAWGGFPDKKC